MSDRNPPDSTPTRRTCGAMNVHERLLRTDPAYVRGRIASENFHREFLRRRAFRAGTTTIAVVVHVVYKTAAQNISDAQVKSQIDVLNRDFRMRNSDTSSVPAVFQPFRADARIEFKLADKDPSGAATTGITRTSTATASFSDDDAVKSAATGGADAWPADKYLNLWVCQLGGGLLGYAQFPGGPAATDGVVILQSAFGTTGTAAAPFHLGRTATHEIGHWLNLRHIWGDDGAGCNGSDYVDDTPNQASSNGGKPVFPHISCNNGPNGDMFMNYMDYTDDDSMFMFTAGQVSRMQACLDGDRSSIGITTLPNPGAVAGVNLGVKKPLSDVSPSLKFKLDNINVKLKFRDDVPKFIQDVKHAAYDKHPFSDAGKFAGSDAVLPSQPYMGQPMAAPLVLATGHHSNAWMQPYPQASAQRSDQLAQQLQGLMQALEAYASADAAGQLSATDRQQADELSRLLSNLIAEYGQLAPVA